MPPAIRSEASRAPVELPKAGAADNKTAMQLIRDIRKSELRFKRAAVGAVNHSDATRASKKGPSQ